MKTKLYKRNQNNTIGFVEIVTRKVANKPKEYNITTSKGNINSTKVSTIKKLINVKNKTIIEVIDKMIINLSNQGYDTSLDKVKSSSNNSFHDGSVMPMLLNSANVDKLEYPCYIQRKYDGMRCISEFNDKSLRMKTRENNNIILNHISMNVNDIYNNQLRYQLDGEIYLHNKDLGDMISIYKNGDPSKQLTYVVYDVVDTTLSFEQRRNLLMSIDTSTYSNIKVDVGQEVNSKEEVMEFYKKALDDGYEGAIVCQPDSLYTCGYRSNSKMKIKPRETSEFKCVGHYDNKGKMSGQSTLICESQDANTTFHVKMKGTTEQREQWYKEFDEKFLGKMITVEYRKISKYGVPIEAVGICVRDYE